MAVAYKVLGQVLSTGTISTYDTIGAQVGVGRSWLVSTIAICNQSASAQTYRLAVTSALSPTTAEFIVFGSSVPANDTVTLTLGITMEAGKYLRCSSSSSSVSFSAFGTEIS
jgi:hypothetical protein